MDCIKKSKRLIKFNTKAWMQKKTLDCKCDSCANFNERMPVYVINCKMHVDRMTKFADYAKKAGLKYERVPCVLGKKFKKDEICKMIKEGILKKTDMTQVEISINMSHYNCWRKLVNSCSKYALILEDDVEVNPDFIDSVNEILEAVEDFSILHLWNGNWVKTIGHQKPIASVGKYKIVQETVPYNAGAVSYIISATYAKYLMQHFFPIEMPQDILMGSYVNNGRHLSLKMKYDRKQECYVSPLLGMPCGGEGGTGNSTQTYNAPEVDTYSCKKCTKSKTKTKTKTKTKKSAQ